MPRIARAQLLPHLLVRAVPEAAEVARDLHRAAGRESSSKVTGGTVDARRVGQAEQLLQLDRGHDRAVVAVVELRGAPARQREVGGPGRALRSGFGAATRPTVCS